MQATCLRHATAAQHPTPRARAAHWLLASILFLVAAVFLAELVNGLFPAAIHRLPIFVRAGLQAVIVIACAGPFLWFFIIEPFHKAVAIAERKASAVLDAAPESIFEIGPDGRIQSTNVEATRLFGYPREELIGQEIEILIPATFKNDHVRMREEYVANPRTRPMGSGLELTALKKSGEEFPVEVSLSTIRDQGGTRVICVVRDVTLQKGAKNEITQINEKLTRSLAAQEKLSETLGTLSNLGELLQSCTSVPEAAPVVARMCQRLFGGQSGAVFLATASKSALEQVAAWGPVGGLKPVIAIPDCWALRRGQLHSSEVVSCSGCRRTSASHPETRSLCVPMVARGDTIGVLQLITPQDVSGTDAAAQTRLMEPDPTVVMAVGERMSIAIANIRLREALRNQAMRDAMTGLFNRRFLEEYLELELLRAMRNGRSLSVLMLDADHFKRFNDTFGHRAGDRVLQEIAGVLGTITRGSDIPCRYGGEELVVVITEATAGEALLRAEEIRRSIEGLAVLEAGQPLGKITVSIGVASVPEHATNMAELLHAADQALYAAKKAGRNRVMCAASPSLPGTPESTASMDVRREPTICAWPSAIPATPLTR